jgi:hypothetical protein
MKCSHWMKAAAAVVVLAAVAPLAWTAPTPGDKSALAQVPATAAVVYHMNGLEAVRDHVVAFLKNAAPDQAALVEKHSEDFLTNGFQGRKLKGLAKDGPIFVLLMELPKPGAPEGPPKMAILAAVTDYAEFRDNILSDDEKKGLKKGDGFESTASDMGGDLFFVDRKDYVVVTPRKDVAEELAKAPTAGLDGKLSKTQAAKFLASDMGVYVNMEDVNKEYADQIKAARDGAEEALKKAEKQDDKSLKMALAMAKQVIGPIFQALEDGRGALVTLEVRPGGMVLHAEAAFKDDSKTAGLFKDLEKLPAGQFAYVGLSISPALTNMIGPLMHGLAADPGSKGGKALTEAFEQWVKSGPSEEVVSAAMPPAGVLILKCAEPEKAVQAAVRMLEAQGEEGGFQSAFIKGKPEIKPGAEKYKNIEFTYIQLEYDFDKLLPASTGGKEIPEALHKQQVEMLHKMMGEAMTAWVGADKEAKTVVQVSAKDWAVAEKLLDQYYKGENTVGGDKAFLTARKELPAKATVVEMIDMVQYVGLILDYVKPLLESAGTKVPFKLPEPVKGSPGYVGFAATLEGDTAGMDLVVTAESVKQIYKNYVAPLMKPKGD